MTRLTGNAPNPEAMKRLTKQFVNTTNSHPGWHGFALFLWEKKKKKKEKNNYKITVDKK